MRLRLLGMAPLMAALALAGCAAGAGMGGGPGATVTRTHLGGPIARAEIRVEPAGAADANFARYTASVGRELARHGWTVAAGNQRSEQVAVVRVDQGSRTAAPARGNAGTIVVTELSVRIQRRSDATVAWEGRGQLEARAGTTFADRAAAVDRLASYLFRDFPGESGRTIRVR
ncbi:MAG: DUF4136 domain-containing protein [Sphingosinicella sp.]